MLQIDLGIDQHERSYSDLESKAHLDASSEDGGDNTLPGGLRVPVNLAVGHDFVNVDGGEVR